MDVDTVMDWYLMGYFAGEQCQLSVPVINLRKRISPVLEMFKGFNSAGASSGGIMMYHVVGITPEAPTLEAAFGGNKPKEIFHYGPAERKKTYEMLTSAESNKVDLVNIGCPHYSLGQLRKTARLLEGKKIHPNTILWVWTAHQLKALADRNGYTETILKAGGQIMTDTCPLNTNLLPSGTKTVATDSAKQAHYSPAIADVGVWFGRMEKCIETAITGQWRGEL